MTTQNNPHKLILAVRNSKNSQNTFERTQRALLHTSQTLSPKSHLEELVVLSSQIAQNQYVCDDVAKAEYSTFHAAKRHFASYIKRLFHTTQTTPTLYDAIHTQIELVQSYEQLIERVVSDLHAQRKDVETLLDSYVKKATDVEAHVSELQKKTQQKIESSNEQTIESQPSTVHEIYDGYKRKREMQKTSLNYGLSLIKSEHQKSNISQLMNFEQLLHHTAFCLEKIELDANAYSFYLQHTVEPFIHLKHHVEGISQVQQQFIKLNSFAKQLEDKTTQAVQQLQQQSYTNQPIIQAESVDSITRDNFAYLQTKE